MSWLIYALLAVACGSTRELLQKRALQTEHTLEYLVVRGFFISFLALFLIPFIDLRSVPFEGYIFCFIIAALGATAILYRNRALKHIALSHVQPLMNLQPLFVLLIAFLFLGETVNTLQFSGILLLVLGTYVLEVDHEHQGILGPFKHLADSQYAMMVVFSVFLFGITNTMDRFMLTTYTDPLTYGFIIWMMLSACFFFTHLFNYKLENIMTVFKEHGIKIFFPGLLTLVLFLFFYKAMSLAQASLVAAVFRLESIVSTIEGGFFFHEKHIHKKSLACLIMILGAVLVVI